MNKVLGYFTCAECKRVITCEYSDLWERQALQDDYAAGFEVVCVECIENTKFINGVSEK